MFWKGRMFVAAATISFNLVCGGEVLPRPNDVTNRPVLDVSADERSIAWVAPADYLRSNLVILDNRLRQQQILDLGTANVEAISWGADDMSLMVALEDGTLRFYRRNPSDGRLEEDRALDLNGWKGVHGVENAGVWYIAVLSNRGSLDSGIVKIKRGESRGQQIYFHEDNVVERTAPIKRIYTSGSGSIAKIVLVTMSAIHFLNPDGTKADPEIWAGPKNVHFFDGVGKSDQELVACSNHKGCRVIPFSDRGVAGHFSIGKEIVLDVAVNSDRVALLVHGNNHLYLYNRRQGGQQIETCVSPEKGRAIGMINEAILVGSPDGSLRAFTHQSFGRVSGENKCVVRYSYTPD